MGQYALLAGFEPERAQEYAAVVGGVGLETIVTRDGAEARAVMKDRGAPALLITDLSLTRADGFTLLGELRKIAPPERAPAIVVSGIPEFRDTAVRMQDHLGVAAVLPAGEPTAAMGLAVRRAMDGRKQTETERDEHFASMLQNEKARLAMIDAMGVVDQAPPDESLQRLVEETAQAFHVPIALVSIVLEDKQWFKAYHGLSGDILRIRSTPREVSFCRHIVEGDTPEALVVPDAAIHPVFAHNPLVEQGIVGSYAGAPVVTPEGHVLGTLCIIDSEPLGIGPDDLDHLKVLARRVAGELEMRSMAHRQAEEIESLRRQLEQRKQEHRGLGAWVSLLDGISATIRSGIVIMDAGRTVIFVSSTFGKLFDLLPNDLIGIRRDELVQRLARLSDRPADCVRALQVPLEGPFAVCGEFVIHRPARSAVQWTARPVPIPGGTGQIEMFSHLGGPERRLTRDPGTVATRETPEAR